MRLHTWLVASFVAATALITPVASVAANVSVLEDLPECAMECLVDWAQEQMNTTGAIECPGSSDALGEHEATNCVLESCSVRDSLVARRLLSDACGYPVRDRSQTYFNVALTLTVLSSLFVAQRFAIKIIDINLDLGWDDYFALFTAIVQLPGAIIGCGPGLASGLGKDIWELSSEQITSFGYWLYVYTALYFSNITLCKLCFIFFYLRVFPSHNVRRLLWGTVYVVSLWGLGFVLASIFQCKPINYYWLRWDREHDGQCVDASYVAWVNGAISIALDLWMIGIPLSQLNGLNLTFKKKFGVGAMFCVGLFVTIISCVRLESLITHGWDSPNATWVKFDVALWSTVEINVGIICACMPSLRSLVVRIFPRFNVLGSGNDSVVDICERNLGFGTTSRIMAERNPNIPLPTRPDAIALHTTHAVEYAPRDSEEDDHRLMTDLKWLRASGSIPSSRSPSDKSR